VNRTISVRGFWALFRSLGIVVVLSFLGTGSVSAQSEPFVTRAGEALMLDGRPYYPIGANAYYLMEAAANGDTTTVNDLFSTARSLGFNVVRTWGFHDSADSLDPSVIQYRPGAFNERALSALDYVVLQAKRHGVRLLLPLVNSWDDFGGMNQYVRWRVVYASLHSYAGTPEAVEIVTSRIVTGAKGRSYRVQITSQLGHDDFFRDLTIMEWFRNYMLMITGRVNRFTGIAYRDEPAILGWELANEPRSSDRTGELVYRWVGEMSRFLKSVDTRHLVGSGEEGFEVTEDGYAVSSYGGQSWLFDGSAGVSFSLNTSVAFLDIATVHLYPEVWNLTGGEGNSWIRDHIERAALLGKPLLLGEFGARANRSSTYNSWLSTALLDGAVGALIWQLLEGSAHDTDGFGVRCTVEQDVCATLRAYADLYASKGETGGLLLPVASALYQNYPNPFNTQTVISYDLPRESYVRLTVYNSLGQRVRTIVDAIQQSGSRKELLDGYDLASGVYFYHLVIAPVGVDDEGWSQTRKLVLIK
jgi:mannan endo-1,4-beta-mannosidase